MRAGLPADDGEVIEKTAALEIYVRDRTPSVRFPGNAYVLAGGPDAAVPVATVNTGTIDAKLYLVGDRALVNSIGDRRFLRQEVPGLWRRWRFAAYSPFLRAAQIAGQWAGSYADILGPPRFPAALPEVAAAGTGSD